MSDPVSERDIEAWINLILRFANIRNYGSSRTWFSTIDIAYNYVDALDEFQKTGDIQSGVGTLLSHLPKEPDSNILDVKRLTAILDIMVSRQWLSRRRSIIAKEAFEITEKGREEHAMRTLRSNGNYRPGDRPRIVVVTMREDENRAVLHRLSNRDFLKGKHRTYATGRVKHRSQEDYSIAVIKTAEQGPNKAQDATRDAIEDLDPSFIFLTGIAGAIPSSEFTLGDVIVATRLHDFSVGALLEGADPELTNQGGPMTKTVQDLLGLLPALDADLAGWETEASIRTPRPPVDIKADKFYGNESWRKKTLDSLTFHFVCKPRTHPRAFTGAVVSSGNLIKDTEVVTRWRQTARDLTGMEMELSGVYTAADRKEKPYSVVAIRGISDIVGFKRDDAWTPYACETAGSFCIALLRNMPSHFIWPERER